ncbi:MAG: DUF4167 domain-containing protein, partial [Bacteroidetes bacterium]|nr:DUF4167 domain-containing protein [Bacteroidota bacterium]
MVPLPARKKSRNRPRRPNNSSRLFESNGPDIKIKGSAIQIVEKYQALSREYHSSGDPISAESCLQHAEHYQRIIEANELKSQKNQIDQSAEPNPNNEELVQKLCKLEDAEAGVSFASGMSGVFT